MSKEFIQFNSISKNYKIGETIIKAANNVSFSIKAGEFAIVLGASGAGKTTVLNILGGLDKCSSGEFLVDGKIVSQLSEKELVLYRRYDIGFVFQFYNLIPNLTAYENIELAAQMSQDPKDIDEVIKGVGLENRTKNFPSQLSGGEQQRVAIARALAKNPKLLLCDEPTGALDYETGKKILKLLHDTCRKNNMTVVLITHNSAIAPMADRVIKMKSGMVVSSELNKNPIPIENIEW